MVKYFLIGFVIILLFIGGCIANQKDLKPCDFQTGQEITISGNIISKKSNGSHANLCDRGWSWVTVKTDEGCTISILKSYSSDCGIPGSGNRTLTEKKCLDKDEGYITVTGIYKELAFADLTPLACVE
jgi:hypothetical protein